MMQFYSYTGIIHNYITLTDLYANNYSRHRHTQCEQISSKVLTYCDISVPVPFSSLNVAGFPGFWLSSHTKLNFAILENNSDQIKYFKNCN